jgi:ubiquinone/menaquinone biosynthesis C-methylase UbiE
VSLVVRAVNAVLRHPVMFELQQRVSNDYERVREEFSDQLSGDGLRVLDIGCSTGTCAGRVIDMERHDYVGVDADAGYVEIARRRHPKGRFFAMDARKMEFPDRHFDRVLFVGVLHHMDDALARAVLADVHRVLRDDGRVLVAEPLFTKGRALSRLFLTFDRGRFIRDVAGYRGLFGPLREERHRTFDFSLHRFASFVLARSDVPAATACETRS